MKNKNQLFIVILIVGFFMGILYWNLAMKEEMIVSGVFQENTLKRIASQEIAVKKYLLYLLKERVSLMVFIVLLGMVPWKKLAVILVLSATGVVNGILISSATAAIGMEGMVVFMLGLFPQFIFYVAAMAMLLNYWYAYPERQWNQAKTGFVLIMFAVGIITEGYMNPLIMKWIVGIL